jgi:hypothetical protein
VNTIRYAGSSARRAAFFAALAASVDALGTWSVNGRGDRAELDLYLWAVLIYVVLSLVDSDDGLYAIEECVTARGRGRCSLEERKRRSRAADERILDCVLAQACLYK